MSESTEQTPLQEIDEQIADLKGSTDTESVALRYSLLREKQAILLGMRQEVAQILGGFSSSKQDASDSR